jgi:hypothetical protein
MFELSFPDRDFRTQNLRVSRRLIEKKFATTILLKLKVFQAVGEVYITHLIFLSIISI